jgi:hypothetical protein
VAPNPVKLAFAFGMVLALAGRIPVVMVRRVRADRERQSMAIDNRHDFHAFSALRSSDFQPATLGHNEGLVVQLTHAVVVANEIHLPEGCATAAPPSSQSSKELPPKARERHVSVPPATAMERS